MLYFSYVKCNVLNKFDLTFRRLEEFLRVKRNRPDIPVSLVDRDFVLDFEAYLKVDYHLQANRYLDSVVTRINTIYYRLCEQSEAVTAQMVCKAEKLSIYFSILLKLIFTPHFALGHNGFKGSLLSLWWILILFE